MSSLEAKNRNARKASPGIMIGGEIVIDESQRPNHQGSNLIRLDSMNSFNSIKGLLRIKSISENFTSLKPEDVYDADYSTSLDSDAESTNGCSVCDTDSIYKKIHQNIVVGYLSKLDSMEHMNLNGSRIVTSNQKVPKPTKNALRVCASDSSIESSLASCQSYDGSFASLTSAILKSHKKTVRSFKKMDSRNHMAKQGRVVRTSQTKRSSKKDAKGGELIDRFLENMASKPSRQSGNKIRKNDSFKKVKMLKGKFCIE